MQESKPQGFLASVPRKVKLLIYAGIPNSIAVGYFLVYLTGYFSQVNVSAALIGTFIGVEGLMLVVAGVPLGILSDRRGRKWILILSNAAVGPAILIFVLANNVYLYILGAALFGIAEAGGLATFNAIIADQTIVSNRTTAFSFSFIIGTMLFALGAALPILFPSLQVSLGVTSSYLHVGVLALLGVVNLGTPVLLFLLLRDYKELPKTEKKGAKRNLGLIAKFSVVNSFIGFGAGLIIPLVLTWLNLKFGVPDDIGGPVLAISGMTIGAAAVASPRASRRFGPVYAIVLTTGSSTVFMFSLAFIPNVFLAATVYIIRAALMNMAGPLLDSYIMGIVLPEERGFTSAVNAVIWRLPNSVSSIIGGVLLAQRMYDLPWLLATALYVVGISSFFAIFRKIKPTT